MAGVQSKGTGGTRRARPSGYFGSQNKYSYQSKMIHRQIFLNTDKRRIKKEQKIPYNPRFCVELWAADSEMVSWIPGHPYTLATQVCHC